MGLGATGVEEPDPKPKGWSAETMDGTSSKKCKTRGCEFFLFDPDAFLFSSGDEFVQARVPRFASPDLILPFLGLGIFGAELEPRTSAWIVYKGALAPDCTWIGLLPADGTSYSTDKFMKNLEPGVWSGKGFEDNMVFLACAKDLPTWDYGRNICSPCFLPMVLLRNRTHSSVFPPLSDLSEGCQTQFGGTFGTQSASPWLVVWMAWVFEPLVLVEGKWETPHLQTTNPNQSGAEY